MGTWISDLFGHSKQKRLQNVRQEGAISVPWRSAGFKGQGLVLCRSSGSSNPLNPAPKSGGPTHEMTLVAKALLTNGFTYASVILIPDLTHWQSYGETWTTDDKEFWPEKLPADVRVFEFHYDWSFASSIETLLSHDVIRMNALRLLIDMQKMQRHGRGGGRFISPVFVAHGYGGLICEQACLFSLQAPAWEGLIQIDRLVLFGTPHFRAGLAQWALISAKKLGISCPDRPEQQNWSRPPIQEYLNCIAKMQTEFRNLNPGPKMACYFSLLQVPQSQLELSPEWAILPGVKAVALNADHFSITKLNKIEDRERLFELIRGQLSCRITQESLKQRWIECLQEQHGQEPGHVSITKPSLTRDKIFSCSPNSEQGEHVEPKITVGEAGSHDHSSLGRLYGIVARISEKARNNDLKGVESLLSQAHTSTEMVLRAAASSPEGLETLKALFVLHGDEITINEQHVQIALNNRYTGADVLELFLFLGGNQIIDATMENITKIAAKDRSDEGLLIQVLLDRYGSQITVAGILDIFKSAVVNTVNGRVLAQLLLPKYKNQITGAGMMGDIVKIAVANPCGGAGITKVLLEQYRDQVSLTDEVAIAAANNSSLNMRLEVSSLLLRAVRDPPGGSEDFTKLLLETRRRIPDSTDNFSWIMLSHAVAHNDNMISRLLLESGQVDHDLGLEDETDTAIFHAIRQGKEDIVRELVVAEHVNIKNVDEKFTGRTALSLAAEKGLVEAVKQLLKIDGMVDSRDNQDRTPLSWAAEKGKEEVVKLLLEKKDKVDINAKDNKGRTPLLLAAMEGKEEVVKVLLGKDKVDIDSKDKTGRTPLSWAAGEGKKEVVKLLLNTGKVNISAEDNKGKTPLSHAKDRHYDSIAQLLSDADKLDT